MENVSCNASETHDRLAQTKFHVVGLNDPGSGRSCIKHPICGQQVTVGSLVRFFWTNIEGSCFAFESW